jgi:hypothetical protein
MKKNVVLVLSCALLLSVGLQASAQDNELVGEWTIVTTGFSFVGSTTSYLDLTIEDEGGQIKAYIYGGPAPIRVDGDQFEIDLDWASGFDKEFLSTFRGSIDDDGNLEGELTHNGASNFLGRARNDGTFTGTRAIPPANIDELEGQPIDMSGIYNRASGLGAVRKLDFSMTARGQKVLDNYLEMDNANSRCASPGLVLASGLPYPMEILHSKNYIVIVYGADYARRIYLDDREFPETAVSSSLGFSLGKWKGETLVVTTTRLSPAFMSTRGQPVSEDAYTTEYFYYDDKGYLHADLVLHDPVNYSRPPHLRRVYDQNFSPSVITKVDCDPYTFFRAMALEDQLEEFWGRSALRR